MWKILSSTKEFLSKIIQTIFQTTKLCTSSGYTARMKTVWTKYTAGLKFKIKSHARSVREMHALSAINIGMVVQEDVKWDLKKGSSIYFSEVQVGCPGNEFARNVRAKLLINKLNTTSWDFKKQLQITTVAIDVGTISACNA